MSLDPAAFVDSSVRSDPVDARSPGLLREITGFWRQFVLAAFDPYRPEQHYMRGPGPAWRAKHRQDPHDAAAGV
jgi:hypothetical protein